MAANLKMEKVGANTNLVGNVTLAESRKLFGNKMLDPKQVHEFARTNPGTFQRIINQTNLHMGVAVSKKAPLGEFIKNGNLEITAQSEGEQRLLVIPESKLAKDVLTKENVILLVKSGYTIDQSGNTYTVVFDKEALECLGQHTQLFTKPLKDGWYVAVDGMPVGQASSSSDPNVLYYYSFTDLGSVRRGDGVFLINFRRGVGVGSRFGVRRGVLVQETGAQASAAPQNGKPELIMLAEGATAAVDKAVQQFGAAANEVLQPVRDLIAKVQQNQ